MRRYLEREEGFTVVELLVVMAIGVVIAAMTTQTVITGLRQQHELTERTHALNDAKITMERVSREIRAADPVLAAEADELRVEVRRSGWTREFHYRLESYSVGAETRYRLMVDEDAIEDGTGATTSRSAVMLRDILDPDVFAYTDGADETVTAAGDVRTVIVDFRVATGWRGGEITLSDEITVRNAREHGG